MTARGEPDADLVVVGATVYTVDPDRPAARAFAVAGGRFLYVGSEEGARARRGPKTQTVDLAGATVFPGFIDAHLHLSSVGLGLREVALNGVASYAAAVAATVAFGKTSPQPWITGGRWDQNLWPDRSFPSHAALSAALPDRPVVLYRVDGHTLLANAKAMQLAGVTAQSADPPGGRILRDAHGEPTGVFIDAAMNLLAKAIPPATPSQLRSALTVAAGECHRWGVTSVGEARTEADVLTVLEQLADEGALDLRVHAMLSGVDDGLLTQRFANGPRPFGENGRLAIRAVKLYADGALGSRGAALLRPYSDDSDNSGLLLLTPEHHRDVCERALRAGFQICTHAIGDRGNRFVLDAYQRVLGSLAPADARARRFRVEHAQVLAPDDVPRFAALGIIPSMQATHQVSDMPWTQARLGPVRAAGAYVWRSLLDTGVIIANGTDAPVESLNPLRTFHAAISRQDERNDPPDGWYPAQRMTRSEALNSMTLWPAFANFAEHITGSISSGKFADFVVLDRDIMTAATQDVLGTSVLATYLGGTLVYDRQKSTGRR